MMAKSTRNERLTEDKPKIPERNHVNKQRPPRETFKRGGRLDVEQRSGYVRIWAIDRDDEIEALERRWFTKVLDDNGSPITCSAGSGRRHFLMEIQKEYYDEDMALQQKEMDKRIQGVRAIDTNANDYAPKTEGSQNFFKEV